MQQTQRDVAAIFSDSDAGPSNQYSWSPSNQVQRRYDTIETASRLTAAVDITLHRMQWNTGESTNRSTETPVPAAVDAGSTTATKSGKGLRHFSRQVRTVTVDIAMAVSV